MIEFACMYCGQPVRAGEELVGKRIECPGCGHSVPVRPRKARGAAESASSVGATAGRSESWAQRSDEEIIDQLLVQAMPAAEQRRLAIKRALAPLLLRYDDLTLFSLSLAFVLVCLASPGVLASLPHIARTVKDPQALPVTAFLAFAGLGLAFSLANVFLRRERYEFEKVMMLLFAVTVTAGIGYTAGQFVLEQSRGLLVIFPAWNIVSSLLILILTLLGIVDTDCITGERPGSRNVLIAAASIVPLVLVCRFVLGLDPLITFSIATCYTMSLSGIVQDLFSKLAPPASINVRTS